MHHVLQWSVFVHYLLTFFTADIADWAARLKICLHWSHSVLCVQ